MWAKDAACGEALRVRGDLLPVYIPQSTVGIVSGGWGREGDNNIRQQPNKTKQFPWFTFQMEQLLMQHKTSYTEWELI